MKTNAKERRDRRSVEVPTKTAGHHGTEEDNAVLQGWKRQGFPENHQDAVSLTDISGSMALALVTLGRL